MNGARGRWRAGLVAVALLAAWPATLAHARPEPPLHTGEDGRLRIDLVWFDPLNVVPVATADIGQEVDEVFADLGVRTTWAAGRADEPTEPPRVSVVFLAAVPSPSLPDNTLGVVTAAPNSRTVWIVVPNVVRALGMAPGFPARDGPEVARALGRVVAHEVVHLAAPRLRHTREGLMQASLGRASLVGTGLRLDAASRRAVLPGLVRLTLPGSLGHPFTIAG